MRPVIVPKLSGPMLTRRPAPPCCPGRRAGGQHGFTGSRPAVVQPLDRGGRRPPGLRSRLLADRWGVDPAQPGDQPVVVAHDGHLLELPGPGPVQASSGPTAQRSSNTAMRSVAPAGPQLLSPRANRQPRSSLRRSPRSRRPGRCARRRPVFPLARGGHLAAAPADVHDPPAAETGTGRDSSGPPTGAGPPDEAGGPRTGSGIRRRQPRRRILASTGLQRIGRGAMTSACPAAMPFRCARLRAVSRNGRPSLSGLPSGRAVSCSRTYQPV
jgi:hypothetical protein